MGALIIALAWFVVPADPPRLTASKGDRRIDWIGGFLITAAICLFTFSLTESGIAAKGWAAPREYFSLDFLQRLAFSDGVADLPRRSRTLRAVPRPVHSLLFLVPPPRTQYVLSAHCQAFSLHPTQRQDQRYMRLCVLVESLHLWVLVQYHRFLPELPRGIGTGECHQDPAVRNHRLRSCCKSASIGGRELAIES